MPPSRRRAEITLSRVPVESGNGLDERLFFALRRIAQGVEVDSRRLAREHAVTGPQLVVLRAVAALSPTTATDISQRVHLSPSTVVGIIDRLEAKHLVRRRRDRRDRRIVLVTATDAGRDLVARAPHPLSAALGRLLGDLSKPEQKAFAASVDRLALLLAEPVAAAE
jgi:DNA-binding MarR family transcriptional regulator